MKFSVITLFPELVRTVTEHGVVGRAFREGKVALDCVNPRDFTSDKHQTVDDRPYGGGPGMVMRYVPLRDVIRAARVESPQVPVVYLSPQGRLLTQEQVRIWASGLGLILLAGRYEGIDERLHADQIDEEWSIGDYVLSGGELAAAVVIDAVARLLPGVLGNLDSTVRESFSEEGDTAGMLDYPQYTTKIIDSIPRIVIVRLD